MPPKQPLKFLELTPEDLEKVNRSRAKRESTQIDEEQLFIAEFGKHFGWGGVAAILNNEIDSQTAVWLTLAARKIDKRGIFNQAQAVFAGVASSKAKKPSAAFKKVAAKILSEAKADV